MRVKTTKDFSSALPLLRTTGASGAGIAGFGAGKGSIDFISNPCCQADRHKYDCYFLPHKPLPCYINRLMR
ncbi:hypothetical protein Barb4_02146 [Bacteroidales bacterium Barb4]|nr:hypothetical protein Barb4_02146 [Bacteroidales bacterium Barb4]